MTMRMLELSFGLGLALSLAVASGLRAAEPAVGGGTLSTPRFVLQFDAEGRPSSLRAREDGREILAAGNPGLGFYLKSRDSVPLRLEKLVVGEGKLEAAGVHGLPRVTFSVREADPYLALRIERMEAVPASREYSLHFQMNLTQAIGVLPLDYMTDAGLAGGPSVSVDWNHLWNRHPENPAGGFALYWPEGEADEDRTILRIWVDERLPHPRVEGAWDLEAAEAWVAEWLKTHGEQSRFWIAADSPEELYGVAAYAEKAGVREVYLFTDTWRGGRAEPFWAVRQLNWGIHRKVFPAGEDDLRRFADHLRERNMNLKLHWISGGIGLRDPRYLGGAPDPRLARWGSGRLVGSVTPEDTVLHFRPDPGVAMPFRLPSPDWAFRYTSLPALHNEYDYDYMVVGNEMIRVGAFEDTDRDVWRLERCRRGALTTEAVAHTEGEEVRGLVSAYGQNFVPENDSTLLAEIAAEYAGLLNRCRISHVEYDGAEIHAYNGRMWGFHKFASLVYRHLDHPVTAYSSSGVAPPCHLEYRLNATRNTWRERQKGIVAVLLDQPFRPASTVLDAHWGLSQMCAHGYRMYHIMKPEPLFGLDLHTLRTHGQTELLMRTASDWKRVNSLIRPDQRGQMRRTMSYGRHVGAQAGQHEQSEVVHVLTRGERRWEIHPTRVLTRPGNADIAWHDGQEHGAVSPRQFIRPGEAFRLVNPCPAQAPRILLRVLWALDPGRPGETAASGRDTDTRGADRNFDYARTLSRGGGASGMENILLQPDAAELRNQRDTRITTQGAGLVIEAANPLEVPVVNEHHLPEWSRRVNLTHHRGMGLWVTGDESGAVLVLQIPGGDYAIPITFSGRRYVEIPNAQVAWATGSWGWRMGSKRTEYDRVNWLKLGFGVLPPKSRAKVQVEGLMALREHPAAVRNPVFHVGGTKLLVQGEIPSGQYFTWEGGATGAVHDANWNRLAELPVEAEDFLAPTGEFDCRIEAEGNSPGPWLEVQLMTRDAPIIVPDAEL